MPMKYQCPACHTTCNVHDFECKHADVSIHTIEKCYIDIISLLMERPRSKFDIIRLTHGDWSDMHKEVWNKIKWDGRVEKIGRIEQAGGEWNIWRLLTADEYMEAKSIPTNSDLHTIWEHGPVPGCRDNALYAMMCYYARNGFSWEDTKEKLMEWLERTGWDDGWDGESAERHIEDKIHVHEEQYHWGNKAAAAARVINSHVGAGGDMA